MNSLASKLFDFHMNLLLTKKVYHLFGYWNFMACIS